MTRDLEHAQHRLAVARALVANLLLDLPDDHPRVKDAKESVAGWLREVERHEREEAFGILTAGETLPPDRESTMGEDTVTVATEPVTRIGLADLLRDTRHLAARAAPDLADWLAYLSVVRKGRPDPLRIHAVMGTRPPLERDELRAALARAERWMESAEPRLANALAALTDMRRALEATENAVEQAELLLLRERFDGDSEAKVVRAVLRGAKAEVRRALAAAGPAPKEGQA